MSFENYLLTYRAQNQITIERNSGAHHTYLEIYQKRIEMIHWTLERYRAIQQQQAQTNENDFVRINRINEELHEKKKIARNNLEKSELRDETEMYRLEESTIQDILSEIGDFIRSNKIYLIY